MRIYLFTYLTTSVSPPYSFKWEGDNKKFVKVLEGKGRGLLRGTIPALPWRAGE
jgi:hypothetical protein